MYHPRLAAAVAKRRKASATSQFSSTLIPVDLSAGIGFRFFTLRLLLRSKAPDVSEDRMRTVDEHMASKKNKKVAEKCYDWDSGYSDG